jgi:hypothetical protein
MVILESGLGGEENHDLWSTKHAIFEQSLNAEGRRLRYGTAWVDACVLKRGNSRAPCAEFRQPNVKAIQREWPTYKYDKISPRIKCCCIFNSAFLFLGRLLHTVSDLTIALLGSQSLSNNRNCHL